jgi:hypothetical protein
MDLAGLHLRPTGDAAGNDGRMSFPITGGRLSLNPPRGSIEHAGGLRFSVGGRHVDAADLALDPANAVVTAVVDGRRVPLLRLYPRFPRALPPDGQDIVITARVTVLGTSVVTLLGRVLGVEKLADGLPLGTMRIAAET